MHVLSLQAFDNAGSEITTKYWQLQYNNGGSKMKKAKKLQPEG